MRSEQNKRALTMNDYELGSGRKMRETNDPETTERKRWGGKDRLKCNVNQQETKCIGVNVRGWNTTTS